MQAGLYRLKHLGITKIHSTNISSAMSQLPDEVKALVAASHIERELQTTPWRLSKNFVACTSQVIEAKSNFGIIIVIFQAFCLLQFCPFFNCYGKFLTK